MSGFLMALWRLVGWRGLLVAGVIGAAALWHFSATSAAYKRGAQSVRVEWEDARRRAEIAQTRRVQKQQDQIDAAEIAMINAQATAAVRRTELDAAIAKHEVKDEKPNSTGSTGAVSSCPFIPEGVRNALNRIGR